MVLRNENEIHLNTNPAELKGHIYAIGGKVREDKLTKYCERYDIQTNTWTSIAALNVKRMNASSLAFS